MQLTELPNIICAEADILKLERITGKMYGIF